MSQPDEELAIAASAGGIVRLRTLILLRWLAIAGQTGTVAVASYVFGLQINIGLCALAIGASVISNLVASFIYPQNTRLPEREIMLTLLFDLSQLALLLYLTGGLNNPFSVLILAPVTVSAMTLRPRSTFFLCALAIAFVTLVALFHAPLRTANGSILQMPQLFVYGFWVALLIGTVFLAIYAGRVTREMQSMAQALNATQLALLREQKLTDLGGVVAAAAHELGTPLATIKLTSAELMEDLSDRPELRDDAALIREQADRCRDILRSMGRAGKDDLHLRTAPLGSVIVDAAHPHTERGKEVSLDFYPAPNGRAVMPNIQRKPEILHGLRNLIQNAVDFAHSEVWINAQWDDERIWVSVADDGPGYPTDLLGRIGDPFLKGRRPEGTIARRPGYDGMGLGLFIAKTLLERTGAEVSFANGNLKSTASGRTSDRRGAIAEISWPVASIRVSETGKSQALGENQPIEI
ncbi:MAG: ActS/PrrB/RegB family redox-sensitive histidine kinase [Pseudomonadota bacterium]